MEENYGSQTGLTEEVVTPQQGESAAEQGSEGEKSSGGADRGQQTHEDNRRYQAARRAGEQSGYDRAMRETKERIARLGMTDPDSGEAIGDVEGLERYSRSVRRARIAQRAKDEGRDAAEIEEEEDNRDFLRDMRRKEQTRREKETEDARQQQFIAKDAVAFTEAYPDVDLEKLDGDRNFRRFCGSRYGKEPLAELYEDYLELAGAAGAAAVAKAGSKAERATGSGGGSGGESLTAAQQRDLDEWNRAYPNMKMTAKEFLSR